MDAVPVVPSYLVATLGSSLGFACGMALQKRAVAEAGLRRAVGRVGWGIGLGLVLAAAALQALALSLGDLSVVKPLGMMQCVFALAIGVLVLGERLGPAEIVGAFAVVLGGVLLVADGGSSVHLARAVGAGASVVASAAVALLVPLLLLARARWRAQPELPLALAAGLLFGSGDAMLKVTFEILRTQTGVLALSSFDGPALTSLASLPQFQLFLFGNAAGLALHQLAYLGGRIAVIAPVSAVTSAAFPAAIGAGVLGEPLGPLRALGVALLIGGGGLVAASTSLDLHRSARRGGERTSARIAS
jgi:drug/metabolite transporter (DMT)-like permease